MGLGDRDTSRRFARELSFRIRGGGIDLIYYPILIGLSTRDIIK